jgi:hypothetical protein
MLKRLIGLTVCLVSILGINFIPLELLLNRRFSSSGAMLLYLAENVTAIFISAAIVFVFGDRSLRREAARQVGITAQQGRARQAFANFSPLNAQILNFVVPAVIATVATSVFLLFFVFGILHTNITAAVFRSSVLWILGFQFVEFTGSLIMLYPLKIKRSETFLNRTLGRVFLLLLCVFLGIFCAAWVNQWFVIPFVILKTIVDVAEQLQIFRDLGKTAYVLSV